MLADCAHFSNKLNTEPDYWETSDLQNQNYPTEFPRLTQKKTHEKPKNDPIINKRNYRLRNLAKYQDPYQKIKNITNHCIYYMSLHVCLYFFLC